MVREIQLPIELAKPNIANLTHALFLTSKSQNQQVPEPPLKLEKKNFILAALGFARSAASSYGQPGYVYFSSYNANDFGGAFTTIYGTGTPLGSPYQAQLYYAFGTVSDPVNNSSPASISSTPTGLTLLPGVTATFPAFGVPGFFDYPDVLSIPGCTNGPITFEVVTYNGADFASSTIRGRSGAFTMNSIGPSAGAAPNLGDNGQPMPIFLVASNAPYPPTITIAPASTNIVYGSSVTLPRPFAVTCETNW